MVYRLAVHSFRIIPKEPFPRQIKYWKPKRQISGFPPAQGSRNQYTGILICWFREKFLTPAKTGQKGVIPMKQKTDSLISPGHIMPLSFLPTGRKARVKALMSNGISRRRMLDLGLISDTIIEALQKSPSGDPVAYLIRGAVIALRSEEASQIIVEAV